MLAELFLVVALMRAQSPEDPPVVVVGEVMPPITSVQTQPSPLPKKKQKSEVKLMCSPRIALRSLLGPVVVSATLRVNHPGEDLWCPGVEWYLDGDSEGSHESDCSPYETVFASQGEPDYWSEDTPRYLKLWQGEHLIVAKLTRSNKVLARVECRVTVQ